MSTTKNNLSGARERVRLLVPGAMAVAVSALFVPCCGGVDPPDRAAHARAVVAEHGGSRADVGGSLGDVLTEPEGSPVPSSGRTVSCKVTWKAGSSVCKAEGKTGSCTATWEGKHATLDEAKKECERQNQIADDPGAVTCSECQWVTAATSDCDEKYQDCINNGPTSCLKEEGGKTQCQRCWERCNAGDSPSAKCRKCKF